MTSSVPQPTPRFLRPRARMMLTIGLELISSNTVALTELVKNAFDADATHVLVRLTGPVIDDAIHPGDGMIEVLDDGVGMSSETIAGTWMEPATPNRRRQRRSAGGRRILGEKGVGRFAAAKLAEELELVSRVENAPEVSLRINWGDFDNEDSYLDEIKINWTAGKPTVFTPSGKAVALWRNVTHHLLPNSTLALYQPNPSRGTLLRMRRTRATWNAKLVSDLRTTLSRLISPFGGYEGLVSDFAIILDVPDDFGIASGLVEPPAELHKPHYTLEATVDVDGHTRGEISLRNGSKVPIDRQLVNSEGDVPIRCGPFIIRLLVWDRDAESLAAIAGDTSASSFRQILNQASGVSIYRDGFRVLPYGEGADDWLRLDLRRVQSPTRRLSNNQIVGYLLISRDRNPGLVDQTNREGIVDGPALEDLRAAVRQLLLLLENERYEIRPRRKRQPAGGLLDRIDLGELRDAIAAKLPGDRAIASMVSDLQRELDERTDKVGEVLARYHRLATLGQLIDRVVHELGQPLLASQQAAFLGLEAVESVLGKPIEAAYERTLKELERRFTTIQEQTRVATDVLRRIEPFGGRRRGRPAQMKLEAAIAGAISLLDGEIKAIGAKVTPPLGSTTVTVDGTELQEVMVNLLTNSLYWLRRVPKNRRAIAIWAERNTDRSLSIYIEDSGPGVEEENRDRIFEPYFTTRENGVGLGLSIAGEIVSDYYGGELVVLC